MFPHQKYSDNNSLNKLKNSETMYVKQCLIHRTVQSILCFILNCLIYFLCSNSVYHCNVTFPHDSTALFKVIETSYLTKRHYLVFRLLDFTFTTTDHSHAESLSSSSKAYTMPSTLSTASLPVSPLSSFHVLSADFA